MTGSAVGLFTQHQHTHMSKASHFSVTGQWELFGSSSIAGDHQGLCIVMWHLIAYIQWTGGILRANNIHSA